MGKKAEKENKIGDAVGYRVVVTPGSLTRACWEFIVLLPVGSQEAEDIVLVKQLCETCLEEYDTYSIYRLTYLDNEEYVNGSPVLGFNPNDNETFEWIFPPYHERH